MRRVRLTWVSGLVATVVFHAIVLLIVFLVEPPKREPKPRRPPVKVKLASLPADLPMMELPEPEPPKVEPPKVEPPKPEPPKPEPPKPEVKEPPKKEPPKKRPPKKEPPKVEPPKVEPPPAPLPQPPKPRKFTASIDQTVPGGGVAVPTSPGPGSTVGDPDGDPGGTAALVRTPPPPEAEPEAPEGEDAAAPVVDVTEVTSLPKLLSAPSSDELRAAYPKEALGAGLEADVKLRILVGASGSVTRVKVVGGAGDGFDEVAARLAKKLRFEPGERGGRRVAVWITYTFKFRLEG